MGNPVSGEVKIDSPQGSHAAGLEKERGAVLQSLAHPAHGQGSQNMAVGDDEDIATGVTLLGLADDGGLEPVADVADEAIETVGDVLRAPDGSLNQLLMEPRAEGGEMR